MIEQPMRYLLEDWLERRRRERLLKRAERTNSAFKAARLRSLAAQRYEHQALPVRRSVG